jgi:hypothetical protein
VLRTRFPVHALAFHPTAPLLAVGTGKYDGGYCFEGELLLLNWERNATIPLFEHDYGRQVLGLAWLDEQSLRVLMAPPDDWQDDKAHVEGHVAVLRRPDWHAVGPRSLTPADLLGPRVPAPRPDGRDGARRVLSALGPGWEPRRKVLAVEELADGAVLATLERREADPERPGRTALPDGLLIEHQTTPYTDPHVRLRIRHGSRDYAYQVLRARRKPQQYWVSVHSPEGTAVQPLYPVSWEPGEARFPGPGAETEGGDLVHAAKAHGGEWPRPGESFVVRRAAADGAPRWVFRTDHTATDLDIAADTAFVAYRNGEILALDLRYGTLRWRHRLAVAGIPTVPTALTVAQPGRLLVGTADGRVLDCATA